VHDSRGIEIVNFTISLALSAGTLMASAGTPYRLVPAHFYLWLCTIAINTYNYMRSYTKRTHNCTGAPFARFLNVRHLTQRIIIVLYPQNGDRFMTIDSVTSLHPMYRKTSETKQEEKAG